MTSTLEDIAKQAKTSVSTVSRVLSGGREAHRISERTRERVMASAKALDYRPNLLARGLRTRKTQTVALLVSDIANPFFGRIASLIEQNLSKRGYSLILCNSGGDPDRESQYLRMLPQKAIDGLILVPLLKTLKQLTQFVPPEMPVVTLDRPVQGVSAAVRSDHEQMGIALCDTLKKAGIEKVAIACGPSFIHTHRRRCEMITERFQVLDTVEGRAQKETGQRAWAKFNSLQLDAIVCTNNFLAMGVMDEIHDPATAPTIAVFDEVANMHLLPVALAGIRQDTALLAESCVKLLLEQLSGENLEPSPIALPSEVITNVAFRNRYGLSSR